MSRPDDRRERKERAPQAGESGLDRQDATYPPETHGLMSWSALRFIHRPSLRQLAWVSYGILGTIAVGLVATVFISQDAVVEAAGEIVPAPGVLQVVAATGGLMGMPRMTVGSAVDKGEVLAVLQMEMEEQQLEAMLVSLDRNAALIERADFRSGLPTQLIDTLNLDTLRDDAVREAAATLEAAVGPSKTGAGDSAPVHGVDESKRRVRCGGRYRPARHRHRPEDPPPGRRLSLPTLRCL